MALSSAQLSTDNVSSRRRYLVPHQGVGVTDIECWVLDIIMKQHYKNITDKLGLSRAKLKLI